MCSSRAGSGSLLFMAPSCASSFWQTLFGRLFGRFVPSHESGPVSVLSSIPAHSMVPSSSPECHQRGP